MTNCQHCGVAAGGGVPGTGCFCRTLDRGRLAQLASAQLGGNAEEVVASPVWHQLFSDTPLFIERSQVEAMAAIVAAIEEAVGLAAYRGQVAGWGGLDLRSYQGPAGAFMGYDFHLTAAGPRLIEINTNAGGAFLNAQLGRAQQSCCGASVDPGLLESFDAAVAEMFALEWQTQRGEGIPRSIAIVDDSPRSQYLYPEFLLARQLLESRGIRTFVLDPGELAHGSAGLTYGGHPIDLVYNRLVDFDLSAPEHAALAAAWRTGSAVVTPNPAVHALYADKRNLMLLADAEQLRVWGLTADAVEILAEAVPATRLVTPEIARELWEMRRGLFFKPVAGHGSKGVYRGSKVTRGAFDAIVAGRYIAQAYVPPSERLIAIDGQPRPLKVDVRLYTYRGDVLLTAARLYAGQTTNFRTPGGGFAPLFIV